MPDYSIQTPANFVLLTDLSDNQLIILKCSRIQCIFAQNGITTILTKDGSFEVKECIEDVFSMIN